MMTDPRDPDVGIKRYCVRDVEEPDLGIRRFVTTYDSGLKSRGAGDLWTAASTEIKERIDLEDHVGDVVATVTVDVDAWEYRIDWEIDAEEETETPFLDRLYRYLRSPPGWKYP